MDQKLGEIARIAAAEDRDGLLADRRPEPEKTRQQGQRPREPGRIDLAEDLERESLLRLAAPTENASPWARHGDR